MTGSAQIIRSDARNLPIADSSVDLVVTSPPYFALRSYKDGGEHYAEQIGSEATPAEFVQALLQVTAECVRVLKPSGSIWVNLGDKYASKSLIGIPWRYALACIDDLGLILRAEVIWSKPNGLPESVTDRVRRSHEQWFHFTKSERYYSAVDELREPHAAVSIARAQSHRSKSGTMHGDTRAAKQMDMTKACHPAGSLPGSVWTIPTEPLQVDPTLGVDHFAAFPTEWPRRIILGWSPRAFCQTCEEGVRPITTKKPARHLAWRETQGQERDGTNGLGGSTLGVSANERETTITGYACACNTPGPLRPAVVLDPFGGTGTTAAVAKALGRHGIHNDMSADYNRLADWRINGAGFDRVWAKVHNTKFVKRDGTQLALFDDTAA